MAGEPFSEISFYIVAHADDWQLFMQPNAYKDLVSQHCKVVFIITTAGDAGSDKKYWSAREEGLKSSVRFCLAPLRDFKEAGGTKQLNYHNISYWSVNNTISYFLRLPDGNLDGSGFFLYGNQSLSKFRKEQITSVTAVDNSATYLKWEDLQSTIQTIISTESEDISNVSIHYLNPDATANPGDHADHLATGEAVRAMTIISTSKQILYVGYSVGKEQQNADLSALFWKAGMFAAYEKAVYDSSGYSTLQESIDTYLKWSLSKASSISIDPEL